MGDVKLVHFSAFVYFVFLCTIGLVSCFPEQGILKVHMNSKDNFVAIPKIMYNNTKIYVKVNPVGDKTESVKVSWILRYSKCMEEYMVTGGQVKDQLESYLDFPDRQLLKGMPYNWTEYMKGNESLTGHNWDLKDHRKDTLVAKSMISIDPEANPNARKRRAAEQPTTPAPVTSTKSIPVKAEHKKDTPLLETWRDGPYIFILHIESSGPTSEFDVEVTIRLVGKHEYISAVDWPLLIFYGVMGIFYIIYGMVWLVLLACSWRDLLRIQFWIGGVILLGMLEKAVFYGEYQSVASTGLSVPGAIVFAEIVSCIKRALARMLVIIVSLGFGIVKPRLGAAFHKVLFVGGVYFISSTIEGCYRALNPAIANNSTLLILNIPLAVVDAVIVWWIFSSLVQTTRTLRLRRNVVKLSLYRHFTNLLIFAVISSIIFMLWSLVTHKLKKCITDWQEIWIDDAFWHLLFSVILLVMMFLWRPSANSQRYAFSPLLDADEDEEDETSMNDAFDGMKMRGVKGQANGSPKLRNSADDDLKWVEENIPSSITDKVLPSLLDSDEEVMTTKYEANKMQ